MSSSREIFSRGVFWNFIDSIGTQFIAFLVSIVLARVIEPKDFGIIALVNVFLTFANLFVNSAFADAVIVHKSVSKETLNTVFFYNCFMAFVLYGILWVSAPMIASFFEKEPLILLIRVLSLSIIFSAFSTLPFALMNKDVDFRGIFIVKLPSLICSSVVGVGMALTGYGVWALVFQLLTLSFIQALGVWIRPKWKPELSIDINGFKILTKYGKNMFASGLLNTIFESLYPMAISKNYQTTQLALYSRGINLKDILVNTYVQAVGKVALPVLSAYEYNSEKLKSAYQKMIKMVFFIIFPVMLGGVVSAENLIVTIYSDKWADASLYFKLACFIGVMYPLHFINLDILRVFKKSELFFRLEVIKRLCFLLAFLLTFRWGIKEMMIGQIVVNVISVYLNSYYSGKLIYYKVTDQLKDILPSFFGAIIMAILIYPINYISFERPICFLLQFMCGVFIYLFVAKLFKNESLFDLISLIKERKII